MIIEASLGHLLRGRDDGTGAVTIEATERLIRFGSCALDDAKRVDDRDWLPLGSNPEVAA